MSTLIPPTPAANKSTEQHQEPSEQYSFNHLLYKVLRLTSQQVQDLNGWMEHRGIPNVHEVIAQHFRKPHALEDNLKFITQGKTCYIQSNVMLSLSLMITYIRHRRYSTKSKYFGPFYYIQIDPQDYDEWRTPPPEEEIHFSGHYDEDEHQNLSSDDNQVIHQENVCSEPPEPLSYSLFQRHFQGPSTSNTQKTSLPKPIWEKPSKDPQQMIIDHNRSLPKSGSPHLSTPNKSPSLLPHLPAPQQTAKSQQVHTHQSDESTTDTIKTETTPSDPLLAMVHQSTNTSDDAASDISHVLSVKRSPQIQVCQHHLFQHANHTNQQLVDHGTNGGLAGSYMHVIHRTHRKTNIQGIDNHEVTGLDVVTGQPSSTPLKEKSLAYSMNMPTLGRDHPFIHQVNLNGLRPMLMKNLSKLVVPNLSLLWMDILSLSSSRMVWPMPPPLENPQIRTWTHIHMSFSPLLINGIHQSLTMILHTLMDWTPVKSLTNLLVTPCLMPMEISMSASLPTSTSSWMHLQKIVGHTQKSLLFSQPISITVHPKSLTRMPYAHSLHGHPHPASRTLSMSPPGMGLLHIPRITSRSTLSLAIQFSTSTDTVKLLQQTPYSLTLHGSTMAQFFCGRDTLVCDAYDIKSTKQFINTLSDNIRKRGAMDLLISDEGKYEISQQVTELLRSLFIQDYQSEPHHQHQNKAENRFGLAKRYTNTVMNTTGCPAFCWLLCLQYICVVLNHLASPTLQGICPIQALQGTTPDVSFMLHFSFYEPVYCRIDSSEPDLNFPSSSNEKKGYWVGFADNQGDRLTWRILTEDTHKIIIRSGVCSAIRTTTNQCLASPSGEGTTLPFPIPYPQQSTTSLPLDPLDESTPNFEHFVKSQSGEDEDNPIPMANIDIPNLLGRPFLLPPEDNGERHMAKIIDIDEHGQPLEDIKFKLKINKDQAEETMSYNQLMDYIQKGTDAEEDPDSLFKFRDIVAHQGPLESTDPNHKGSKYNVMVEWESGEVTYEPLTLISKDDPITCAVYAKKHDLLDTTEWKHLK